MDSLKLFDEYFDACQLNDIEKVKNIQRDHWHLVHPNHHNNRYIANLWSGSWTGETPLTMACICGHVDVVAELLKHPYINVNQRNKDNDTPLIIACKNPNRLNLFIVRLLVNQPKINLELIGNGYMKAIDYAFQMEQHDLIKILLPHSFITGLYFNPTIALGRQLLNYRVTVTLISLQHITRLGLKSPFAKLMSLDLIRLLCEKIFMFIL